MKLGPDCLTLLSGPNSPLEVSQWLYTSGGVKSNKCGLLLTGNSLYFAQTGARHATTHDLDLSKAKLVEFWIFCFTLLFPE